LHKIVVVVVIVEVAVFVLVVPFPELLLVGYVFFLLLTIPLSDVDNDITNAVRPSISLCVGVI
jgi:hypothetical protein